MSNRNRATRRGLLAAGLVTGIGGLAGCAGSQSDPEAEDETGDETGTESPTYSVERVVSVPGDQQPENLALDGDGHLYFGLRSGAVHRVAIDSLGDGIVLSDTEQVATLPETTGVEIADDGSVYVAVPTDDEQGGVWEVPPDGEAAQLATIGGFPNGVLADGDRLLVTESRGGTVFEIGPDGSKSTWLADDQLDPSGLGANGITRSGAGDVYIAVMEATDDTGRLLRVPVGDDGSAGEPAVYREGSAVYGADGVTTRDGRVYLAANHRQRVLEVPSAGDPVTIATAEDGLVFPSDVVAPDDGQLYICDLASGDPESAGIYRATA